MGAIYSYFKSTNCLGRKAKSKSLLNNHPNGSFTQPDTDIEANTYTISTEPMEICIGIGLGSV